MLVVKMIGSFVAIGASTAAGYVYAGVFAERVRQLRNLQYALRALESEIIYTETPLANAFSNVSARCPGVVGRLLTHISETLVERHVSSVQEAFDMARREEKKELCLDREEIEVLSSFMNSLGNTDMEGQKKIFNITMGKLEMFESKADELNQKNNRLYRYMGVCAGVLTVILLI